MASVQKRKERQGAYQSVNHKGMASSPAENDSAKNRKDQGNG